MRRFFGLNRPKQEYVVPKGPAKNKFPFSGVEAPTWQGARSEEYPRYLSDEQRSQGGWIGGPKREVILGWALRPKESCSGRGRRSSAW